LGLDGFQKLHLLRGWKSKKTAKWRISFKHHWCFRCFGIRMNGKGEDIVCRLMCYSNVSANKGLNPLSCI
jgi:hypothetical protein